MFKRPVDIWQRQSITKVADFNKSWGLF